MARRVELKGRVSADDSRFQARMRGVVRTGTNAAKTLGRSFAGVASRVTGVGAALGGLTAGLSAVVVARRGIEGLFGAFNIGSQVSDFAAQTGFAADQVALWGQVLKDAGGRQDQFAPLVFRSQKAVAELGDEMSTQVKAFDRLGLSFKELKRLDPSSQFRTIFQSLQQVQNQNDRSFAASAIFGARQARDLVAALDDDQALERAAATIGRRGEILRENAGKFDRVADLLNNAGTKLENFFLGAASKIVDTLLPFLERFNSTDFVGFGERFGVVLERSLFRILPIVEVAGRALLSAGDGLVTVFGGIIGLWENFGWGTAVAVGLGRALVGVLDFLENRFIDIFAGFATGLDALFGDNSSFEEIRSEFRGFLDDIGGTTIDKLEKSLDEIIRDSAEGTVERARDRAQELLNGLRGDAGLGENLVSEAEAAGRAFNATASLEEAALARARLTAQANLNIDVNFPGLQGLEALQEGPGLLAGLGEGFSAVVAAAREDTSQLIAVARQEVQAIRDMHTDIRDLKDAATNGNGELCLFI